MAITLSHGNWHEAWAANGLINAAITKPMEIVTLPVMARIGVETFAADQHLAYTATLNKTGAATLDATKPTLTITAPLAGQHLSNAVFTVAGKASDSLQSQAFIMHLNNSGWNLANTMNNWTDWTSPVTLKSGTNTFSAYAVATSGNVSLTNTVKFVYVEATPKFTITSPGDLQGMTGSVINVELTKDGLEFSLHLPPGLRGHIQVSTDLRSWETVADFAGTDTTLTFRDPAATNSTSRFYRAVVP